MRIVSTSTSTHRGIHVKTVPKSRGIETSSSAVNVDAAVAGKVNSSVCVTAGQTDGEIRTDPVVDTKRDSSGTKVEAAGSISGTNIREFGKARSEKAPTILRYRRYHRRARLAFRAGWPGQALAETRGTAVNGEARGTKTGTALPNINEPPLQVSRLHVRQRDREIVDRGQYFGSD